MDFSAQGLLIDFALASSLIFVSQYLRARVNFIKKLLLPAPLIAGFIGLFLGHQFLNILPFSRSIGSYPYLLIVVLFGSLFIGKKRIKSIKETIVRVQDTFYLNLAGEIGQFGFSLLVGYVILHSFFPETRESIAVLMPAGFVGGHGYAASIGGTLQEMTNWDSAIAIGQTFATIGLIVAIGVGLIIIRYGISKGYTNYITKFSSLPHYMKTGFFKLEGQEPLAKETTSSISLETLTWHISLILTATGGAYLIDYFFRKFEFSFSLPLVSLSMLCGVLLNSIIKRLKLLETVDHQLITRIGSSITDYLLFFGIASIKISIVIEYWRLIVIFSILGLCYSLGFVFLIGKHCFRDDWFERSIFIFGWTTGVVAMGVILLRIVDPEFKTTTLADYSMAYTVISIIEMGIVTMTPIMVAIGKGFLAGSIMAAAFVVLILLSVRSKKRT